MMLSMFFLFFIYLFFSELKKIIKNQNIKTLPNRIKGNQIIYTTKFNTQQHNRKKWHTSYYLGNYMTLYSQPIKKSYIILNRLH